MSSNNSHLEGKSNLDAFFEMFDWVDEDISELNEKDENQVGSYECLFIAFNNLRSFCKQIGLDFSQIEDQYLASVNPDQSDKTFWDYDLDADYSEIDELAGFCKLLETIEKAFSEYEKFCEKSDEKFIKESDSDNPKLENVIGNINKAEAKIAGITPAVFNFNGKCEDSPP